MHYVTVANIGLFWRFTLKFLNTVVNQLLADYLQEFSLAAVQFGEQKWLILSSDRQ